MKPELRLIIANGNHRFFGPGVKVLLNMIDELSSIKAASAAMGMSYTKSLRILRDLERELGFAVVVSEKGGINRGGTTLTENGKRVLAAYEDTERDVFSYAEKLVGERFRFLNQDV